MADEPGTAGATPGGGPLGADPGLATLIEDWVTIWQSELAGLVVDREMQESALRLLDGWAAQSRAALRLMTAPLPALVQGGLGHGADNGRAGAGAGSGADAAARTAAVDAAPDGRDALIGELLARVAALERRVGGGEP